ncbi:hypothetical protein [Cylindrospermopsis raciborskii]|nr:hypothetical protein [Cylindrospermopsis raciborskii]
MELKTATIVIPCCFRCGMSGNLSGYSARMSTSAAFVAHKENNNT